MDDSFLISLVFLLRGRCCDFAVNLTEALLQHLSCPSFCPFPFFLSLSSSLSLSLCQNSNQVSFSLTLGANSNTAGDTGPLMLPTIACFLKARTSTCLSFSWMSTYQSRNCLLNNSFWILSLHGQLLLRASCDRKSGLASKSLEKVFTCSDEISYWRWYFMCVCVCACHSTLIVFSVAAPSPDHTVPPCLAVASQIHCGFIAVHSDVHNPNAY